MDVEQARPARSIIYLKPQNEWGWQVALYLYLAGIGAGSLATGILMEWLGYAHYPSRAILLWGPILVALGALFLVLKLGIKRRFLNTVLNPKTSWLSRGFYILAMCIIVGVIILAISILPLLRIDTDKWSPLLWILDVTGFILALATAIYTGILIQAVRYVPFWNTPLLPALFTVSSLSTGTMATILSVLGYSILTPSEGYPAQMMNTLTLIEQSLIIIEALVLALYLFSRYKAEEEGKSSVRLLLSGNLKFMFWLGIIVPGFFFPIILEFLYSRSHNYHLLLFLAGAFLLIGGLFLRFGVIYAGIKEQHPFQKLIENQYYLRTFKENQGRFLRF